MLEPFRTVKPVRSLFSAVQFETVAEKPVVMPSPVLPEEVQRETTEPAPAAMPVLPQS